MKNLTLTCLMLVSALLHSQEHKLWRYGVSVGMFGNKAEFAGGDAIANSRFVLNDFGAGSFHFNARYDANHHWMGSIGIGFTNYGFEYGIANDYQLAGNKRNTLTQRAEFAALEIPLMIHYKFNPNCKQTRWVVGAGFSSYLTGTKTIQSQSNLETENGILLHSTSKNSGSAVLLRWSIAREKVFNNGHIFNAALVWNYGLGNLASTTIHYNIDQTNYTHQLTNSGNYFGLRLSWFFAPHRPSPRS